MSSSSSVFQRLPLAHATVDWCPDWLSPERAETLFQTLLADTLWDQPMYHFQGQSVAMPRLVAWHGDPQARYGYSGVHHRPEPWTPALQAVRQELQTLLGVSFNSVLLNRYRTGKDSVAWHADDERELGVHPVIASLSLGASRSFAMKPKAGGPMSKWALPSGSLLVMAGATQEHWLHQVPKTTQPVGERINLTFRHVRPSR